MRISLNVVLLLVVSLMNGCGGAGSAPAEADPAVIPAPVPYQYLGTIQSGASIKSVTTGITYPYHVYLPPNYATSGKTYPVIYGTDAQWIFPSFSRMIDMKKKQVIFVGIEEGPLGSNRRATDYVPPGATTYIDFLKKELVPFIENNYRTNGERTFTGTSYGGLLGAVLLSTEPVGQPYFKNYMLFDGSFFALQSKNTDDEDSRFAASTQMNITLVLTSANNPGNFNFVNAYQSRYENRHYVGLTILRQSYNVAHVDVADPSFNAGIDLIY
jgi:hypothetical protein